MLRRLLTLLTLLLAGCSSPSRLPDFTASGYLADRGAVRIWRKNAAQATYMVTVFTPFSAGPTETTRYSWQQQRLISIERRLSGNQPDDVTLRFDGDGRLSFMQRQLAGRREAVSQAAIDLYQFDATRMLTISDALLAGRVLLQQGRWQGDGVLESCQGESVKPALDDTARQMIQHWQSRSVTPVSVSWLEAPAGTQLLLVSAEDACQQAPQEADL